MSRDPRKLYGGIRRLLERDRSGAYGTGRRVERSSVLARNVRFAAQRLLEVGGLVRPPYGHFDLGTWLDATRLGLQPVAWSGHAKDWCVADSAALLERLRRGLVPGAVLLLHDRLHDWEQRSFADRGPMLTALEELLATDGRGWRFVTVPQLLALGPARRKLWWKRGEDAWLAGLRTAIDG